MTRVDLIASAVAALGCIMLLSACGQKGPLYLPDRGTVITRPAAGSSQPPAGGSPQKPDDRKDTDQSPPPR